MSKSKKKKVVDIAPQESPKIYDFKKEFQPGETIQVEAIGLIAILETLSELADSELQTLFPAQGSLDEIMKEEPVSYYTDKGVKYASLAAFIYHNLHFAADHKEKTKEDAEE